MTLTAFLLARFDEDEAAGGCGGPDRACDRLSDRWLAELEAKRRIVDLHALVPTPPPSTWRYVDIDACAMCGTSDEYPEAWPCETLRALAAVYADHPDYQPEWKP